MAGAASAHLWVKIDLGNERQLGPGKIALLRLVGEKRSIAAAAREMNMSYRRAWLLIEELNTIFGPVVLTYVGGKSFGGAELTPLGQRLIARFEAIARRTEEAVRDELEALAAEVKP
ncbi:MAG: winged helix-turn-helix domain-containing protein [Sphingomonadales bacterium]